MQQWGRGLLLTSRVLIKSYRVKYFKHKLRQGPKSVSNEICTSCSLGDDQHRPPDPRKRPGWSTQISWSLPWNSEISSQQLEATHNLGGPLDWELSPAQTVAMQGTPLRPDSKEHNLSDGCCFTSLENTAIFPGWGSDTEVFKGVQPGP